MLRGHAGCFGLVILQGQRPDPATPAIGHTPAEKPPSCYLITGSHCFVSGETKSFVLFAMFHKIPNFLKGLGTDYKALFRNSAWTGASSILGLLAVPWDPVLRPSQRPRDLKTLSPTHARC